MIKAENLKIGSLIYTCTSGVFITVTFRSRNHFIHVCQNIKNNCAMAYGTDFFQTKTLAKSR